MSKRMRRRFRPIHRRAAHPTELDSALGSPRPWPGNQPDCSGGEANAALTNCLRMNQSLKAVLWAIVIFGTLAVVGIEMQIRVSPQNHKIALLIGTVTSALAVVLIAVSFRKDKAPDFLRKLAPRAFERDGFAFALVPRTARGSLQLSLLFQNRYSGACSARVVVKPQAGSKHARYKALNMALPVDCPQAGFGVCEVGWDLPQELQGQQVQLEVAASVVYPEGRGELLRFKEGMRVGKADSDNLGLTILGAFAGAIVVTRPARTAIRMPSVLPPPTEAPPHLVRRVFWMRGQDVSNVMQEVANYLADAGGQRSKAPPPLDSAPVPPR